MQRRYALAILTIIALSLGFLPAVAADDAAMPTGTLIITLSAPLLDGAPTDQYIRYNIRARRIDHSVHQEDFR